MQHVARVFWEHLKSIDENAKCEYIYVYQQVHTTSQCYTTTVKLETKYKKWNAFENVGCKILAIFVEVFMC